MPEPKRFVHIAYIFHPDMGYDVNLMLKHFAGRFENIVLTSSDVSLWNETPESIRSKDEEFQRQYNCRIIRQPYFKLNKKNTVPFIRGLRKMVRRLNPGYSFLHGVESHAFSLGLPSVIKHGGRVGVDTHTLYNQVEKASFIWKLYYYFLLKPFYIKKINRKKIPVFYTADDNRHFLIHSLGVDENLVHKNEIATDTRIFYPFKDELLAQKLSIKSGEKVLMYIGKFDDFKQPHLILEALKKGAIPFPIHLILGGPKNAAYFEKYFAEIPHVDNVRITVLPSIPNTELYKYYSLATAVVIPEQNSLSALDAQACKTPVIMKNDATNAARLQAGGLVYAPGDLQDLFNQIMSLLSDDALRTTLAEKGYQHMLEHYDYQKTMEMVLGVLEG